MAPITTPAAPVGRVASRGVPGDERASIISELGARNPSRSRPSITQEWPHRAPCRLGQRADGDLIKEILPFTVPVENGVNTVLPDVLIAGDGDGDGEVIGFDTDAAELAAAGLRENVKVVQLVRQVVLMAFSGRIDDRQSLSVRRLRASRAGRDGEAGITGVGGGIGRCPGCLYATVTGALFPGAPW